VSICIISIYLVGSYFVAASQAKNHLNLQRLKTQSGNSIGGFIFGKDREPIADVDIELLDDFSRFIARTKTTTTGRYVFYRIPAGRYSIHVLPRNTGYEEQTKSIEINNITFSSPSGGIRTSGFENIQEDFYLKPRGTKAEKNAAGSIFVQDVPPSAKKAFDNAITALEKKRQEEAINYLKQSLAVFPDYYLALQKLAEEYVHLQQYEAAQELSEKAVAVNPKSYNSWYVLSYSSYSLKQYQKAIDSLQKAVELVPASNDAFLLIGISLKRTGRFEEAEIALKKANEIVKGQKSEILWQLALLYGNDLKKYKEAAESLEQFLKLEPENANGDKIRKLIKEFREKATK
jgi:tetratricopeptide (TPR) repeat protein